MANVASKSNEALDAVGSMNTGGTLTAKLSEVAEVVTEASSDFSGRAGEFARKAGDRIRSSAKEVPAYIQRNPVQSLFIGFGLGVFSAFLLSRR